MIKACGQAQVSRSLAAAFDTCNESPWEWGDRAVVPTIANSELP